MLSDLADYYSTYWSVDFQWKYLVAACTSPCLAAAIGFYYNSICHSDIAAVASSTSDHPYSALRQTVSALESTAAAVVVACVEATAVFHLDPKCLDNKQFN